MEFKCPTIEEIRANRANRLIDKKQRREIQSRLDTIVRLIDETDRTSNFKTVSCYDITSTSPYIDKTVYTPICKGTIDVLLARGYSVYKSDSGTVGVWWDDNDE